MSVEFCACADTTTVAWHLDIKQLMSQNAWFLLPCYPSSALLEQTPGVGMNICNTIQMWVVLLNCTILIGINHGNLGIWGNLVYGAISDVFKLSCRMKNSYDKQLIFIRICLFFTQLFIGTLLYRSKDKYSKMTDTKIQISQYKTVTAVSTVQVLCKYG